MKTTRLIIIPTLALCVLAQSATLLHARPIVQPSSSELQLAINRLGVVGGALYVAAHPDDENTAMLAWLANEKLVRTAYLSVTRGDGGQNLIGTEKGDLLGVIRTQELLEARRIDGAEQFFTRAVDFGYSRSPEETETIWGREAVLSDIVFVIRKFRPDVIITRFPTDGSGGHGQHTSSATLAEEAFRAAGDPNRFPEQLSRVSVWQPRRLFWNNWRPAIDQRPADAPKLISVDLGTYNPLLGSSYTELAARSRSMHKSQGFGSGERRGTLLNYFEQKLGDPAADELFSGIDLTWGRVPSTAKLRSLLASAAGEFDPADPSASVPVLLAARKEMLSLPSSPEVAQKLEEIDEVIRGAAGLWMQAVATDETASPGSAVKLKVSVVNRSSFPMRLERIELPFGSTSNTDPVVLQNNTVVDRDLVVTLPRDLSYSSPYWLAEKRTGLGGGPGEGLFPVSHPRMIGEPESDPSVPVTVHIKAGDQQLTFTIPTLFRWVDRVKGDQYRQFEIAPPVTTTFLERTVVFPNPASKVVRVAVRSNSGTVEGQLRLKMPAGWGSKPEVAPISLAGTGEETVVTFAVAPPQTATGTSLLRAEITTSQGPFNSARVPLRYDHIPEQTFYPTAELPVVRTNLHTRGSVVGYVMGSGDDIPEALGQIGYTVHLITDEEIASADLSRFDTIISGIRAYNTRDALKRHHGRFTEYVEQGGTYIVQYNTTDDTLASSVGPWPLTVGRDRVTVETAPVTMLDPAHELLTTPNRITQADFENWVQERGLYFASEWDPRYIPILASSDPGDESRRGGMLVGRHGKGIYIYTGYSWFRQLPAGVAGAWRLFANMVSAGNN